MDIIVTQDDIAAGEPNDGNECPVARAAARAFGHRVFVGPEVLRGEWEPGERAPWTIRAANRGFWKPILGFLSRETTEIVEAYDDTDEMEPFSFTLNLAA